MAEQALLVLDAQAGLVDALGLGPDFLEPVGVALDTARASGLLTIFVRVAFRDGLIEVSSFNKSFASLPSDGGLFHEGASSAEVHPAITPNLSDVVVTKKRVGAFMGTELDMVLRSQGVRTLVLAGVTTSGVVLSTVRQAADMDYGLLVLSDACADPDPEVHRVLVEKIFPQQADVSTVAEWKAIVTDE